jgi:lipoate-protein ligase A
VVTSVQAEVGRTVTSVEMSARLVEGFAKVFDLEPDPFTPEEREQARALVCIRRLG